MTIIRNTAMLVTLAAAFGLSSAVLADSTNATCKVREKGNDLYNESGDCSYSQRQGNVTIRLRNGETYDLRPGSKSDHYKDQKGRDVKRKISGDDHEYNWNHRHITVSFDDYGNHSGHNKPEIFMGSNGEGEVTFNNNCVVYYNSQGRRTSKNNNCNSGQGRTADDAMARYRRDHRMSNSYNNEERGDPEAGFAAWQAEQDGNDGVPEIFMGRNGEGEVTFSNNCVVYYNSSGNRTSKNDNCNSGQGRTADDAMQRHRREQGY